MGVVSEHTKTIDGITYKTRTYPASKGLDLMHRLARLLDQDSVGQALLSVDDSEIENVMGDLKFMLALIVSAAKASTPGEWSALAMSMLEQTEADKCRIGDAEVPGNVGQHFDTHFAGRYKHMLDVLVWAARLGFAGP